METLDLDFNRLDAQGRVRISPEARRRLTPTLHKLSRGDRVLVVDGEGSQCEGVLEDADIMENDGRLTWVVRLDMATWQDGR